MRSGRRKRNEKEKKEIERRTKASCSSFAKRKQSTGQENSKNESRAD
jgi:hypothetical protein